MSQLMAMLGFRVSFPTRPHFTEQHSPSVSGVCSRWENLSITPQHTPRIDYIAINIHRIVGIHRCDEFQFGASVVTRQLGKFQVVDGKIPKLPKLQRLQKLSDFAYATKAFVVYLPFLCSPYKCVSLACVMACQRSCTVFLVFRQFSGKRCSGVSLE